MSHSLSLNPKKREGVSDTTIDFPPPGSSGEVPKPKCRLARPDSSGTGGHKEVSDLLRHRLLLAALITGVAFLVFFIRCFFEPQDLLTLEKYEVGSRGLMAALLLGLAIVLKSPIRLSYNQLRWTELTLFGTTALYFLGLQALLFHDPRLVDWANAAYVHEIIRLANVSNVVRWFALIVIYGSLIPNTWKRCARNVAILAAFPISMMVLMCFNCPVMGPYLWNPVLDSITLLGIGSAIAIFGSYKVSELHQEALEAKKLGQYQLKEKLGAGGMGEVFIAEHMMLRRTCAIKIIHRNHATDETTLSRFQREVQAMANLTHWNTVEIYDYGLAEDGTFYYAMEYLPGMSLQDLVDQYGPISPARTIHFLKQICAALQEAHGRGLIHRDIKPSNIIACERGGVPDVAKLLDFGLVHNSSRNHQTSVKLTTDGMVLGSPPYMSPEQAKGEVDLDGRSDIYSLGGLAYFLLTGAPMFERETPIQVLMAHVYEPPIPLRRLRPDVPRDLEDVIMRCLSKDKDERFEHVEAVLDSLEQCESADEWSRAAATEWWGEKTAFSPIIAAAC